MSDVPYYEAGVWSRSAVPPEENPVSTPTTPTASTPEPVLKAAAVWGSLATFVVTALGVLVAVGALSTEQSESLSGVVTYVSDNFVPVATAIVGFTSLLSGVIGSFATAVTGRRKVTPVLEQRVQDGI